MGLDNGIMVRRNDMHPDMLKTLLKRYKLSWDKGEREDYELCYWRKCWNVRNAIYGCLNTNLDNDLEYELSLEEMYSILHELKELNSKEAWNHGSSIWLWEEYSSNHKRNIKNLKRLIRLKKKWDNILVVYFYDSY